MHYEMMGCAGPGESQPVAATGSLRHRSPQVRSHEAQQAHVYANQRVSCNAPNPLTATGQSSVIQTARPSSSLSCACLRLSFWWSRTAMYSSMRRKFFDVC